MKEPVDHVLRPQLPWRTGGGITECGYDASKVSTLTRDEFLTRLKDYGQQRTAMLTCMTCSETSRRWGEWSDDPRKALQREIEWECRYRGDRGHKLHDELLAIADLIATHKEEFNALIDLIEQRREWNSRKSGATKGRPSRNGRSL